MTHPDESKQPERSQTTPTRFVRVGDVRFAYRRFGKPSPTPLLLLQHFRGSLDNWDPALLNSFAEDRTVITFDNAGIGFSTGDVPDNVAAMADHALDFIDALDLRQVDLLGFSLGGYIAQHRGSNNIGTESSAKEIHHNRGVSDSGSRSALSAMHEYQCRGCPQPPLFPERAGERRPA